MSTATTRSMTFAVLVAGCAAAPAADREEARETSSVVTLPEPAPAATVTANVATSGRGVDASASGEPVVEPPTAGPATGGESICDIDPEACKPLDPKDVAKCGCSKRTGRDQQRCLIDCIARQRNELDRRIRRGDFGPS